MSWLRRGQLLLKSSPLNGRKKSSDKTEDPISCPPPVIDSRAALDSFKTHWMQAWDIMQRKRCPPPGSPHPHQRHPSVEPLPLEAQMITVDDVTTIVNHIDQMVTLLLQESQGMTRGYPVADPMSSTPIMSMMSPLLDYLLMDSMLDKLLEWSSNVGEFTNVMKLEQLKLYELLVSQLCHKTALFQKPLVRPLLQLLATCSDCAPVEVEKRLVILLNSLCVCLSQNPELLELFFVLKNQGNSYLLNTMSPTSESSPQLRAKLAFIDKPESRFLIFSLLIPFVHREGPIGQQARDALLLIMSLSQKHENVGVYIAENSNFCPVLATGLSGLYSSLPRKLNNEFQMSEDWHQITPEDIQETPELQMFLNSLEFCNAVVQVSHPLVQQQLIEYVFQGFLVSVIGPALHQDILNVPLETLEKSPKYSNTLDEIIATTAYLDLFLRTVSEPILLQAFLKFICVEKFDEQRILNTLISRIVASSKLSLVTLVLFRTMIDLCCEDVMVELIFKYITPCQHLGDGREKQLKRIDDVSRFDASAELFLSLIPVCCFGIPVPLAAPTSSYYNNHDSLESHSIVSYGSDFGSSPVSGSYSMLPVAAIILHNYVEYLNDAHSAISNVTKASMFWTRRYDKHTALTNKASDSDLRLPESPRFDSGVFVNNNHNNGANELSPSEVPANYSENDPMQPQAPTTNGFSEHIATKSETYFHERQLIGPFLSNLLVRLENMLSNDVYTNLQLTGIISRLAAFPQPLLRSFLLNTKLLFHPKVRSLPQILSKLQLKLETVVNQVENFDEMLVKAKRFFYAREERLLAYNCPVRYFNDVSSPQSRRGSSSSADLFVNIDVPKDRRRRSLKQFLFRGRSQTSPQPSDPNKPQQSLQPVLEAADYGKGYRYLNRRTHSEVEEGVEAAEYNKVMKNQKLVLAALVFEEFLKELSSLSHEHYILEGYKLDC